MRVLDLFCGGGGASAGYASLGWDVIGMDLDPQPSYPFTFIRGDAISFLQANVLKSSEVDLIHASPPCQPYSKAVTSRSSKWNDTKGKDEEALIPFLRYLLQRTHVPWVIENVVAAPLDGEMLCGSMFGLDIPRHRVFETSFPVWAPDHSRVACHGMAKRAAERRGWDYRDMTVTGKGRRAGWSDRAAELLGITHPMRQHDLKEAIPPAYTAFIGSELVK